MRRALISSIPVLRLTGLAAATLAAAACGSSSAQSTPSTASVPSTTSAPSGTGASASAPCGPAKARTLASDSQARVYSTAGMVYGCAKGSATRSTLGQVTSCLRSALAGPFALAGTRVAYAVKRCGVDTGRSTVMVRSLTTGRTLASHPATSSRLGVESYTSVTDIALGADGAVGWISQAGSIVSQRRTVEVHVAGSHGARIVDSSSTIAVRSLRVSGTTLRWSDGGRARSAPLS